MEKLRKIGIILVSISLFMSVLLVLLLTTVTNSVLSKYFYMSYLNNTDVPKIIVSEFRSKIDDYIEENQKEGETTDLVYDAIFKIVDEDFVKTKGRTFINQLDEVLIKGDRTNLEMDFSYEKTLLIDLINKETEIDVYVEDLAQEIPLLNENLQVDLDDYINVELTRTVISFVRFIGLLVLSFSIIINSIILIILLQEKAMKLISKLFLSSSIVSLILIIILSNVFIRSLPYNLNSLIPHTIFKLIPYSIVAIIISIIMMITNYYQKFKKY